MITRLMIKCIHHTDTLSRVCNGSFVGHNEQSFKYMYIMYNKEQFSFKVFPLYTVLVKVQYFQTDSKYPSVLLLHCKHIPQHTKKIIPLDIYNPQPPPTSPKIWPWSTTWVYITLPRVFVSIGCSFASVSSRLMKRKLH